MNIYSETNYRKIYEQHYGPIPKDNEGRSYEIHHIDGNHNNNDINNLKLVTIQEHYDIHYAQGDWAACLIMSKRMRLSPDIVSKIASLSNQKRVQENNHNFVGGDIQREHNNRRVKNGTHHFVGETNPAIIRVKEKTHHLLKRPDGSSICSDNVKNGKHATQQKWTCPHCGLQGKNASAGKRWHFDNCKSISSSTDT
jgi:hypothetical protein